ncbi:hypothetical protein [Thiohalophilus sp.]|nr:hypothetical protein [Thiohalophilus sp.]MDZ7660977.1 hypothetical protein [Thiohalophilus sp.]
MRTWRHGVCLAGALLLAALPLQANDADCAAKGIASVQERLDFIE